MKRPKDMTADQIKVLADFAKSRGHFWKRKLRSYWLGRNSHGWLDDHQASRLQQIRNTFGPSFLSAVTVADLQAWQEEDFYRGAAKQMHEEEGTLEIDEGAPISADPESDEGCYIQAWVWVSKDAMQRYAETGSVNEV